MRMPIQGVLFDWRGTLVRDPDDAWWVRSALARLGRDTSDGEVGAVVDRLRHVRGLRAVIAAQAKADCSAEQHRNATMLWFSEANLDAALAETLYALDLEPVAHPAWIRPRSPDPSNPRPPKISPKPLMRIASESTPASCGDGRLREVAPKPQGLDFLQSQGPSRSCSLVISPLLHHYRAHHGIGSVQPCERTPRRHRRRPGQVQAFVAMDGVATFGHRLNT
jgi:hypothetical protein